MTNYQVKASALRGYVHAIDRLGLIQDVRARVTAPTRALMDAPPPSSTWIDAGPCEEIVEAVEHLRGIDAIRALSRQALSHSVAPHVRPVIDGILRLFGASPATLFARTELMTRTNLRGVTFAYRATSARSGVMRLTFPDDRDVPTRRFQAFAGSFELVFEMCGVRGVVGDPTPAGSTVANHAAEYTLRW